MPKVTIEFNLPEEREEFELANKAGAYMAAIADIQEMLRKIRKYDSAPTPDLQEILDEDNVRDTIALIEQEVYKICEAREI